MKLSESVRQQFVEQGRVGGLKRASSVGPDRRREIARRGAAARWIKRRFGAKSFEEIGMPAGDLIDAGLADLAAGKPTLESLLVSIAEPRLRREGVPVSTPLDDPENRLYELLERSEGELAFARYHAYLRQAVSFADACRLARVDRV